MSVDSIMEYFKNPDLIKHFGDKELCWPLDDQFDDMLISVEETFEWKKERNDEKGKRLEHFATYLLSRLKCVEVVHDLRIESNQIDHKVTLNMLAGIHPFLKEIGLNIISECKNQKSPVDVGQVQKMGDLLDSHNVNLGIFFSRSRIAGNNWKDAEGKRKKIYCKKQKAIISFTFEELSQLKKQNKNLLTEMRIKYEHLKFQVEEDDVSVDEESWYDNPEKVRAVLWRLFEKGYFTYEELQEKLALA